MEYKLDFSFFLCNVILGICEFQTSCHHNHPHRHAREEGGVLVCREQMSDDLKPIKKKTLCIDCGFINYFCSGWKIDSVESLIVAKGKMVNLIEDSNTGKRVFTERLISLAWLFMHVSNGDGSIKEKMNMQDKTFSIINNRILMLDQGVFL